MEVVRITLSADVVISPRYTREPLRSLADYRSFSHFHLQAEHNASLFQYVRVSYETRCKDSENLAELKPFSEKTYENLAQFKKIYYLCPRNYEDSRIRQSESNDNRTRRHPVDLLAGHLL